MFVKNAVVLKMIGNKGPIIACPQRVHVFNFFSYNINKLSNKSVKIYGNVGVWLINSNFAK